MEPVEVGIPIYATGFCGEIEQGETVGGPRQTEIHLQDIADGEILLAVQAVIETGRKLSVGDAGTFPTPSPPRAPLRQPDRQSAGSPLPLEAGLSVRDRFLHAL